MSQRDWLLTTNCRNILAWYLTFLVFLVSLFCSTLVWANNNEQGKDSNHQVASVPPELEREHWQQINLQIEADRHRIYKAKNTWQADTPAQNYSTQFRPNGPQILMQEEGPSQAIRLNFKSVEVDGKKLELEPVQYNVDVNQFDYDHGMLVERYVNWPTGLEQSFIIQQALTGETLHIVTVIQSSLQIEMIGNALVLGGGHQVIINYAGMEVIDSRGDRLSSNVELLGNKLIIEVDIQGARYPLKISRSAFSEEVKLIPFFSAPYGDDHDVMGHAVSIKGDRAIIGAPGPTPLFNSDEKPGEAFVFERDAVTDQWLFAARITPEDSIEGDQFGASVSLLGDDVIVGAPGVNRLGSAYIFNFNGEHWSQSAKLVSSEVNNNDNFGSSVSLDSNRVLVGDNIQGIVHVFDFNDGNWMPMAILLPEDASSFNGFGISISLLGDRALIGATSIGTSFGSAYIFDFDGTNWNESSKLVSGGVFDEFGRSVSLSFNRALIGAPQDDANGIRSGSAYLFDLEDKKWVKSAKLLAKDLSSQSKFGNSVSLSGDRALVGAFGAREIDLDAGSAYIFDFDGVNWNQSAKLLADEGARDDEFGFSVGLSGDDVLIGMPGDDDNGESSGSAFVFSFENMGWTESVKLLPGEGAAGDVLGRSVSLFGTRALVGAPVGFESFGRGSAYIFEFDGEHWRETAKLTAPDGANFDQFGRSVDLSDNLAMIGAPGDDDNGASSGSVYVFDFDGTTWSQSTKLLADDGESSDRFGLTLSLSGTRVLIGAPLDNDNGSFSGSAYLFDFDGTNWNQSAKLLPGDGESSGQFGIAVSLSDDRALIGSNSNSAYIFDFDGSVWNESAKLVAENPQGNTFGSAVSLYSDRILVGSFLDFTSDGAVGAAYVFDFDGLTWSQSAKLLAEDGIENDTFGWSVSLFADRALIGAPGDNSAYMFFFDDSDWIQTTKFQAEDSELGDSFGVAVSLSDRRVLIGASGDDDNGPQSGSAYAFFANAAPIPRPDFFGIFEDQPVIGNVLLDNGSGADFDPNLDSFEVENPGVFQADGIGGTVELSANGDLVYSSPEDVSGVATFEYTVVDELGFSDTGTVTIIVVATNDPPSLLPGNPIVVLEDIGMQSITDWTTFDPGAADEDEQSALSYFLIGVSNPSLFAVAPQVHSDGTLTFTSEPDLFGNSTFDVVVQDDGGVFNGGQDTSEPQTFTITVEPVNDAPSFIGAGDVTEIENRSFSDLWASEISSGPANELAQGVQFLIIENSNPGLFTVQPSISASGLLSFEPATDAVGSAALTVLLMDDGGTANTGIDKSEEFSFIIEVISIEAAVDLAVDKTSGSVFIAPGGDVQYLIMVDNLGLEDVVSARVVDTPPTRLGNLSWTCIPQGLASCITSGVGPIDELVDLPSGDSVAFQLNAILLDGVNDSVTNTATVIAPTGVPELDLTNNSDSDTDAVGLFVDGFESVEPD